MSPDTLAAALEREHREIDAGISAFVEGLRAGEVRAEAMARALSALRRHIYLEEAILFPPLRSGGLMAAIVVMIREHGQLWRMMDGLAAALGSGSGSGAEADLAVISERCRPLIEALEAHNLKEERVIYPAADESLPAEASGALRAFLATGTMPEGWVCKAASAAKGG